MRLKIFKEFKEFAVKGNMIDIAVGVIIGGAFNKVVDALVKEVILPPLSLLTDGINWQNKKIVLREAINTEGSPKVEEVAIGYGKLLEVTMDFIVVGFTIFIVVKIMNSLRKKAQDPKNKEVTTPKDIELLDRISELMQEQVNLLKEKGDDSKPQIPAS